jgi:hypothetical protein
MEKHWKIEVTEINGKLNMYRENEGFNVMELIGFAELIKQELISLTKGKGPKINIKRTKIEDDSK